MKTIYSEEQKEAVLSKVMQRGSRSLLSVSQEAGVPQSTIHSWISRSGDRIPTMKKTKNASKWGAVEKLKVLIETGSLLEPELGTYLRKEGLFSHQLVEWKAEIVSLLTNSQKPKFDKEDRESKKIIKVLEREISRKDKALAEASALLILQKKVNLIWGNKDEDEK